MLSYVIITKYNRPYFCILTNKYEPESKFYFHKLINDVDMFYADCYTAGKEPFEKHN